MTEVWGKGDLDAIDELVAEHVLVRDNVGMGGRGRAAVREMIEASHRAFPDQTVTIEDVIVAGDRVVLRYVWRGTHTGAFHGIAGTGRTVTTPVVEVLRLARGKVVEEIGYMDLYGLFQQLGVLPEPERLAISSDTDRSDRPRIGARTAS
jgi:steroid delta-isomerase-like uncharacterized protein